MPIMTITILIGNSDDKLKQYDWSMYVAKTNGRIQNHAKKVHFDGRSSGLSKFQNAAWVIEISELSYQKLVTELQELIELYGQDSIAIVKGTTEFIRRAEKISP